MYVKKQFSSSKTSLEGSRKIKKLFLSSIPLTEQYILDVGYSGVLKFCIWLHSVIIYVCKFFHKDIFCLVKYCHPLQWEKFTDISLNI